MGCDKLFERMTDDNLAAGMPARSANFTTAMGDGARNIRRLHAMEAELHRSGCNTNADGSFRPMEERIGSTYASSSNSEDDGRPPRPFTPGGRSGDYTAADRPMLDPTPAR